MKQKIISFYFQWKNLEKKRYKKHSKNKRRLSFLNIYYKQKLKINYIFIIYKIWFKDKKSFDIDQLRPKYHNEPGQKKGPFIPPLCPCLPPQLCTYHRYHCDLSYIVSTDLVYLGSIFYFFFIIYHYFCPKHQMKETISMSIQRQIGFIFLW